MRLALHLTNKDYLYDFIVMGIEVYITAGDYGTFTLEHYSIAELKEINNQVNTLYVLVNGLYDEKELEGLFNHIDDLAKIGVSGLLFQDMAVLRYVIKKKYSFNMMYAPNTLNTNPLTLDTLKKLGISSAFVSKEIPLEEQLYIKRNTSLPLMIQGHGVMYMAASKRKLIRNYIQETDKELSDHLIINPRGQDYRCHIYEDNRGTCIYTENKLYTLDLFNIINVFDYLYIETLFMDPLEMIEVSHMYQECIHALEIGKYNHDVKEYMPLLKNVSYPLDRGFLKDKTLYHIEDVKRRDNS